LFYRVTGRLNALLWKLPLPRRVLVRLSGLLYRSPPMPGEVVLVIIRAVQAAGIRCWIAGGWGVDALVGRGTRTHRDLDLVVEHRDMQKAVQVLLDLGYWEWYRLDPDVPLSTQIVFTDHPVAGRAVDLHPLELFGPRAEGTVGEVEGRQVPCLSVATQVENRTCMRRSERADLELLRRLERSPPPPAELPSRAGADRT
ncbi:MAG: lincosamide nucleotidyltransferase, partial [Solirubrobacteraceae bacterium]|nr:lincosamide nucleotidyltransferase [Solirubrobacteraceae bacterium]